MKTSTTGLSLREVRGFRRELLVAVLVGWVAAVVAAQTPTTYEIVHAFRNSGGPNMLVRAADGTLYGTTSWGGTYASGSICRIDSSGVIVTLQ